MWTGEDFLVGPVASADNLARELSGSLTLHAVVRKAGMEGPIRVRLGERRAVLVQEASEHGAVVAVAYASPSPIVKSLARMVRRALGIRGSQRVLQGGSELRG